LVGESRHGGVDNRCACINHFLRGVAEGLPLSDVRALVGTYQSSPPALAKLAETIVTAGLLAKMRSQHRDHCCLLARKVGSQKTGMVVCTPLLVNVKKLPPAF